MRVQVVFRQEDAVYGGRLESDLKRTLRAGEVVAERPEVIVAVVGPGWDLELPGDVRVVPVLLDGVVPADWPRPIPSSVDYWEAMVDQVVERIREVRPGRASRIVELLRRRWQIGTAIALAGLTLSALVAFGVLGPPRPEMTASLTVGEPTAGVTLLTYRGTMARKGWTPDPRLSDRDGQVFDITVKLEHGDGEFELRWAILEENSHGVIDGLEKIVGDRFDAEHANVSHAIWVPCPLRDLAYIVEFKLISVSNPDGAVAIGQSEPAECRVVETT